MANKKIQLRILIIMLTLSINSMAAHLQTSPEPFSPLSAESYHHPKIIESTEVEKSSPRDLNLKGNFFQELKNIIGDPKTSSFHAAKDINKNI